MVFTISRYPMVHLFHIALPRLLFLCTPVASTAIGDGSSREVTL